MVFETSKIVANLESFASGNVEVGAFTFQKKSFPIFGIFQMCKQMNYNCLKFSMKSKI